MKKINTTKSDLINAFDQSEKKQLTDVCRIAGVALSSYYFHLYKDADFRRQVIEKKMEILAAKLADNGGEK
jgi:hypothetical protein